MILPSESVAELVRVSDALALAMEAADAAESETFALEPGHTVNGIAATAIRSLLHAMSALSQENQRLADALQAATGPADGRPPGATTAGVAGAAVEPSPLNLAYARIKGLKPPYATPQYTTGYWRALEEVLAILAELGATTEGGE